MPLTLNNDLTGLVSREVAEATRKVSVLGESLVSRNNKNAGVVDTFLGNSLHDREFSLGAIAKSASYSVNLVNITENYLDSIASFLQQGVITIATAGSLSDSKVAVLQKHINGIREQIDILIDSANFDGRKLLGGGANETKVQVGPALSNKLSIVIRNLSGNRLYRTSLTNAMNAWIAQDSSGARTTYYTQVQLAKAVLDNENLISFGAYGVGGSGTLGAAMTDQEIANALFAAKTNDLSLITGIEDMVPQFVTALGVAGAASFATANAVQIAAALLDIPAKFELFDFLRDGLQTNLTGTQNRAIAFDMFQSALTSIRGEKSTLQSKKTNLLGAIDALRATINVTEKTANSYTKTNYVLTAQQYSQFIRQIVASITALQAANKIPEAAQRLVDALAR